MVVVVVVLMLPNVFDTFHRPFSRKDNKVELTLKAVSGFSTIAISTMVPGMSFMNNDLRRLFLTTDKKTFTTVNKKKLKQTNKQTNKQKTGTNSRSLCSTSKQNSNLKINRKSTKIYVTFGSGEFLSN